jgi:uncharacterized surface protein with fasciclin (FAS1) repeats
MQWIRLLLALALAGSDAACGGDDEALPPIEQKPLDLLATLQTDGRFGLLVAAVNASGNSDLEFDVGLTVFAPTNAAIEALMAELGVSRPELLADQALLERIVRYHVVEQQMASGELPLGHDVAEQSLADVRDDLFKVESVNGSLVATDGRKRSARLIQTDLAATNGVIHVIDKVLLPAELSTRELLAARPEFSTLLAAINALNANLRLGTLIAPTDEAFNALFAELSITRDEFINNSALVINVLDYLRPRATSDSGINSTLLLAELQEGLAVPSRLGGFRIDADGVLTDAKNRRTAIAEADVFATDGVIHVVTANVPLPDVALPVPAAAPRVAGAAPRDRR